MLFANVCARFISSQYGEFGYWSFLGFGCFSLCLVRMGSVSFAILPNVYRTWVA